MRKVKEILLIVEDDPGLQKQMRWSFDAYEALVAKLQRIWCNCGGTNRRS